LDYRVAGAATAAVLASAVPGLAEFGVALPTLRLTVMPLGSATALVFALSV
jgi:phage tail protein X